MQPESVLYCSFCGADRNGCKECDSDCWCTPKWLADLLGEWDLDPCSNDRSHIISRRKFDLANGQNGVALAPFVAPNTRVFANVPFSSGNVIDWIKAYRHTRFCFLVRMDLSTQWFAELYPWVGAIVVPHERINFEPPRGYWHLGPDAVPGSMYMHALYFAREEDIPDGLRRIGYVMIPRHKERR